MSGGGGCEKIWWWYKIVNVIYKTKCMCAMCYTYTIAPLKMLIREVIGWNINVQNQDVLCVRHSHKPQPPLYTSYMRACFCQLSTKLNNSAREQAVRRTRSRLYIRNNIIYIWTFVIKCVLTRCVYVFIIYMKWAQNMWSELLISFAFCAASFRSGLLAKYGQLKYRWWLYARAKMPAPHPTAFNNCVSMFIIKYCPGSKSIRI